MKRTVWIVLGAAALSVMAWGGWFLFTWLDRASPANTELVLELGPTPSFVTEHPPVELEEAQFEAAGGVKLLLVDQQYDTTLKTPAHYIRTVVHVASSSGTSAAATKTLQFDPSFQRLELNHARVVRDGVVEDRRKRLRSEFLRQEWGLGWDIMTGAVTADIRLDDVRVGDTVDVALTLYGAQPAFGDRNAGVFPLTSLQAAERFAMRTVWPKGSVWKTTGSKLEVASSEEGGRLTLTIEPQPVPAYQLAAANAPDLMDMPMMMVSSFSTWADVAGWAAPLFAPDPSAGVREHAARIRSEHANKVDQIIAALRFVQDDIRYLALTLGEGGYIPQSTSKTLEGRYGDCKAKAFLLISLLSELDVDSQAVLVNAIAGDRLDEMIASPLAFNHVIVSVQHEGRRYWLDPTRTKQGGDLERVQQSKHGFALVLDGKASALEKMHSPPVSGLTVDIREDIDLSDGPTAPARIELVATFRGDLADQMRASADSGLEALKDQLTQAYGFNSNVQVPDAPQITDDREANAFEVQASLFLDQPMIRMGDRMFARFNLSAIAPIVPTGNFPADKKKAVDLAYVHTRHLMRLQLPTGMTWRLPSESWVSETEAFRFERTTKIEGDSYQVFAEMRPLAQSIEPTALHAHQVEQSNVLRMLPIGIWIAPGPSEDLRSMSFAPLPERFRPPDGQVDSSFGKPPAEGQ